LKRTRHELDVGREAGVRGDFGAREWRREGSAGLALSSPHDAIQTHAALPTLSRSKRVSICSVIATLTYRATYDLSLVIVGKNHPPIRHLPVQCSCAGRCREEEEREDEGTGGRDRKREERRHGERRGERGEGRGEREEETRTNEREGWSKEGGGKREDL